MTYTFLGPDPVEAQLERLFGELSAGRPPRAIERKNVDVKEEAGRRRGVGILGGTSQNETAARALVPELACMANTPGGGAIVLGVADTDGQRIGTELDAEWLRHRVYQLTDRRITVDVREVTFEGARLLVLRVPPTVEPVPDHGVIRWRVEEHCVEVDRSTWEAGRLHRSGYDWSATASGYDLDDASAVAVETAREYLRSSGDHRAEELASVTAPDMLRRLCLVGDDDRLTHAGALLFVTTPAPGIDYVHRDVAGSDSTLRVERAGPLIVQLHDVELAAAAHNRVAHVQRADSFAVGQVHALPPLAVREAIVNGITHRDWGSQLPTTVEHVGDTLAVSSPGGFIGGIEPGNIITHPPVARYRSLAEAMSSLCLAERQGTGVDRMVRDLLAIGHRPPVITELGGPYVRTALLGGRPDEDWIAFLGQLQPAQAHVRERRR